MNIGGMPYGIVEAIDALLPCLGGQPEDYVDPDGRPDLMKMKSPDLPHSDSTAAAAALIWELWTGNANHGIVKSSPLWACIRTFDSRKKYHLSQALTLLATDQHLVAAADVLEPNQKEVRYRRTRQAKE